MKFLEKLNMHTHSEYISYLLLSCNTSFLTKFEYGHLVGNSKISSGIKEFTDVYK